MTKKKKRFESFDDLGKSMGHNPESNRKQGQIKQFKNVKKYGFIDTEGSGDIFFHISGFSEYVEVQEVRQGRQVEFNVVPGDKGPKAVNIAFVDTSVETKHIAWKLPCDTREWVKDHRKRIDNFSLYINKTSEFKWNEKKCKEEVEIPGSFLWSNFDETTIEQVAQRSRKLILQQNPETHEEFTMHIDWRLVVGLGIDTVYETGMTLHHIYGIPYIPGSALKGVTRNFILQEVYFPELPNPEDGEKIEREAFKDPMFCDLFGCGKESIYEKAKQGHVIFYDAFPAEAPTIEADIMNSHYQDYYSKGEPEPPTDDMDPNPVTFLTVKDTVFRFLLGEQQKKHRNNKVDKQKALYKSTPEEHRVSLLSVAGYWCKRALSEHGIGAKTAVGYGYFTE